MSKSGYIITSLCAVTLLMAISGCSAKRGAYATVQPGLLKNRAEAKRINDLGINTAESGNLTKAERLFRDSLRQDLTYAPAHNNLGLVLLSQRRYYEAAWEFEYAARLDAQSLEPVLNLGRLYETIGCTSRAVRQYELALEVEPQHTEALVRLGRLAHEKGHQLNKDNNIVQSTLDLEP